MPSMAYWKSPSRLLNVPNEVLSQIVAGLTPNDLINTALSCKMLYNFCKDNGDLERHTNHHKAYTVLNLGLHGMDPLDLMEKLNKDWRIAYYVKAVHLKSPKTGPLFPRRPHGDVRFLMHTTAYAEEAMLALLAPLLLLLPNLGRLSFIDFTRQPPGLKEIVRRVDRRTVLSRLQVVEFVKSEKPTDDMIRWGGSSSSFRDAFNPWGFVLSVHTLRAENITWGADLTKCRLQITTLELINCSVEIEGLETFLGRCTNLKRFTYDWNLGRYFNGLFGEGGLFSILNSRCANTLEYVRLTGGLPPITLMIDNKNLSGLHRLKQAHLSLDLFYDAGEYWQDYESVEIHNIPGLRHILLPLHRFLPRSTEEITIDFRKTEWKRELHQLLNHLVYSEDSRSNLPFVKSVVVESDKLTADEVKDFNEVWQDRQEQGATLDIEFRPVDV